MEKKVKLFISKHRCAYFGAISWQGAVGGHSSPFVIGLFYSPRRNLNYS